MPVIRIPETLYTSKAIRGQGVNLYSLLAFTAPPGNGKRLPSQNMVEKALETGLLVPEDPKKNTIVEPTSGNTGVSLAYCARQKNEVCRAAGRRGRIRVVAIVPDGSPIGKKRLIEQQGAVTLEHSQAAHELGVPASTNSIELARLYARVKKAVFLNQYSNPWNPESWENIAPQVHHHLKHVSMFVSAVGSAGTLLGLGRYFRTAQPGIEIVATMPYLGHDIDGTRDLKRLESITHDWRSLMPRIEEVDENAARGSSQKLIKAGIPVGPSSGAAFATADHVISQHLQRGTLEGLRHDGDVNVFMVFQDTSFTYV